MFILMVSVRLQMSMVMLSVLKLSSTSGARPVTRSHDSLNGGMLESDAELNAEVRFRALSLRPPRPFPWPLPFPF